jgi:hypothetical protein
MMPFSIVRVWVLGILGLIIVGTAAYLAWDWYRYDRDDQQLYGALGVCALALVGRFAAMPAFGFGKQPPGLTPAQKTRITRPDGTEIQVYFVRRGLGPVAILTHGWSLTSEVWGYAEQELPKECEIIAWDLRGLGKSSKSPANGLFHRNYGRRLA